MPHRASWVFKYNHLYTSVSDGYKCVLCGKPWSDDLYVPCLERISGLGPHGLMKVFHLCYDCYKANCRRKLKDKAPTRPM